MTCPSETRTPVWTLRVAVVSIAIVTALCAIALMSIGTTQQAWAGAIQHDLKDTYAGKCGLSYTSAKGNDGYAFDDNEYTFRNNGKPAKIANVKVGNSNVISATGYNDQVGGTLSSGLIIRAKAPGSSKLTYKLGGVKHKATVKVAKYQNPFSSLKVGPKDYKTKFNKYNHPQFLTSGALTGKLVVEPAKNWSVERISVNGSVASSKDEVSLDTPSGTHMIEIVSKNKKTKVVEQSYIYAK